MTTNPIPLDFLDDDEDSYITNLAPDLGDEEIQDFPINLGGLDKDVIKLPLQAAEKKQWNSILKLIEPVQLLSLYQLLTLAISKTWEFEHKCAVTEAIKKIKEQMNETQTAKAIDPSDIDPLSIKPTCINPPITIEVFEDTPESKYMTFGMTEVLTSQILPLFSIMVMKSHFKVDGNRYEYRFRLGTKAFRVMDAMFLLQDIGQILSIDGVIQSDDIANRLYLGLLSTILKRNTFVPVPVIDDDDEDDDEALCAGLKNTKQSFSKISSPGDETATNKTDQTDYSDLWYELCNFSIMINYSTRPFVAPVEDKNGVDGNGGEEEGSGAETRIDRFPPNSIQSVDFHSSDSMFDYFSNRSNRLLTEILNNIVINYDREMVILTIPCQNYALPNRNSLVTAPKTILTGAAAKAAAAKAAAASKPKAQKRTTTTASSTTTKPTAAATTATTAVEPAGFSILPLHGDVFSLLPNLLITVIKAIITFKIKQAQNDHAKLRQEYYEKQALEGLFSAEKPSSDHTHDNGNEDCKESCDSKVEDEDEKKSTKGANVKKVMKLPIIHKYASLFKFLSANRPHYTPQSLLNTWITMTEANSGQTQQDILTEALKNMVITPKCLQNPNPTETEPTEPTEAEMETLALDVSISLASNYVNHGLSHGNKVTDSLFNKYNEREMELRLRQIEGVGRMGEQ